jgi:hypothetical protein
MLQNGTLRCTANCCSAKLTKDDRQITIQTDNGGRKEAYECACSAVTIVLARTEK